MGLHPLPGILVDTCNWEGRVFIRATASEKDCCYVETFWEYGRGNVKEVTGYRGNFPFEVLSTAQQVSPTALVLRQPLSDTMMVPHSLCAY